MKSRSLSGMKWIKAEATQTRLMGVVGMVAYWESSQGEKLIQIFHLDYEVYGIDGYYHLINPSEPTLRDLILSVTGGLGGAFVPISEKEYVHLLKTAYLKNPDSIEEHVDFDYFYDLFMSFEDTLSEVKSIQLLERLTPELKSDFHRINYLIMRIVGCDPVSVLGFLKSPEMVSSLVFFDQPYTLIKNTSRLDKIEREIAYYQTESVVDYEDRYRILVFEIGLSVQTHKIVSVQKKEELTISSIEASFNLNRPEYMIVTQMKDSFFERKFAKNNPEMMKQSYYQGQLYIEFNSSNDHVCDNPYVLNGDIYAMYFFSRSGQFLIASFSEQNLNIIDAQLIEENAYEESLHFVCELKTDDPVLFDYMNSSYESIFDFLSH